MFIVMTSFDGTLSRHSRSISGEIAQSPFLPTKSCWNYLTILKFISCSLHGSGSDSGSNGIKRVDLAWRVALPAPVEEARQPGRRTLAKIWGRRPFQRGLPTRRRLQSGGPKWLIARGSPGRGLKIGISRILKHSDLSRAFLELDRQVSRVLEPANTGTGPTGARLLPPLGEGCRRPGRGGLRKTWGKTPLQILKGASPRVVACCRVAKTGLSWGVPPPHSPSLSIYVFEAFCGCVAIRLCDMRADFAMARVCVCVCGCLFVRMRA